MTAIAGWVGGLDRLADDFCRASLKRQLIEGSRKPSVRNIGEAAFGIALFETLPEDAADRQPILFNEQQMLVADLRLDNREELLASLNIYAADAHKMADSAILCLCWQKWGETCLDRIVGDYAIALFNSGNRELTLARSLTGQRPLHYAHRQGATAFSSGPTGLIWNPDLWQGFDEQNLASILLDRRPADATTYFEGIKRVMPGELVKIQGGQARTRTIWQPSFTELRLPRTEDYVEKYRELLDAAVRSRLRRIDGPAASHLSSGYDSSAVAATAARLLGSGDPLLALTSAPRLGFHEAPPRGRIADESGPAAVTARLHGMTHLVIRTTGTTFAELPGQAAIYQEPVRNIVNCGWMSAIERSAADRGVRIMLSGELGNLTLNAGGIDVLGDLARKGEWVRWWNEARLAARRPDLRWRGILAGSFQSWLPAALQKSMMRHFRGIQDSKEISFLRPEWISKAKDRRPPVRPTGGDSFTLRYQRIKEMDYGAVRKGSLAEHGIDTRDPTADRRIIEFSLSLPPERLFCRGESRPLAAAALSDRVPAEILSVSARGYQAADWYENVDRDELGRMLAEISQSPTARQFIDLSRLRTAIDEWPSDGLNRFATFNRYGVFLPLAFSAGYFFLSTEKMVSEMRQTPGSI